MRDDIKNKKIILTILISFGVISSGYFFTWWLEDDRINNPFYIVLLASAFGYVLPQIYFNWFILLNIKYPVNGSKAGEYTVDVFLPTYNEPLWLVKKSLRAAIQMDYPHKTYLIDDGNNEEFKELAEKYGAIYLRRESNEHNKAGNVNNAIKRSGGEIIAIFDIDHVPGKNYLCEALSRFNNPKIGVVQILLDHSNTDESFVSKGCSELNDDFFGPATLGMNGCNCTTVFGSNSVFRRAALESIGGYQPGLAEDLNTSITLHSAGWQSEYVPETLAKGLVPADLISFFKQQLKWSRGVFETLFRIYPKVASKLDFKKNVCYLTRMTYYLSGPVISIHIIVLLMALFNFSEKLTESFTDYIYHAIIFLFFFIVIQNYASKNFRIKKSSSSIHFKGLLLVFGTWPIYTFSFIYAILGISLPFIPTPKELKGRKFIKRISKLLFPQMLIVILLISGLVYSTLSDNISFILYAFSLLLIILHSGIFISVWEDWKRVNKKERSGLLKPIKEFSSIF